MSVHSKMTAIADKIRALLGITGTMGLDAMSSNLGTAQTQVESQATLLDQAISALAGKVAGGGGNSGPFSAAEEFIWTAPSKIVEASGEITIPHTLGVVPDGYTFLALEMDNGTAEESIVNNIIYDRSMLYSGVYPTCLIFGIGDGLADSKVGLAIDVDDDYCKHDSITFLLGYITGTVTIPAGKQYRVLVYKR